MIKRTDLPIQLQALLADIPYVTLATTCPDGTPWNTPVFGYFDESLNLYWASWVKNQHSRNIAAKPHIFAVVFNSKAAEGEGLGIYFQMTARAIKDPRQVVDARRIYTTKFGENLQHEPFIDACPRRLYKAVPQRIWYNTDAHIKGNFVDKRVAVLG